MPLFQHETLKSVAALKGYNTASLSREVGVSKQTVSNWMRGAAVPRPAVILKLVRVLGLTYADLFVAEEQRGYIVYSLANEGYHSVHEYAAHIQGRLLYELSEPLLSERFVAPLRLAAPVVDDQYLAKLCQWLRDELGTPEATAPSVLSLCTFLRNRAHTTVVPVMLGAADGGAHDYQVLFPETQSAVVLLNIDQPTSAILFRLSLEIGCALVRSVFSAEETIVFARKFAQVFLRGKDASKGPAATRVAVSKSLLSHDLFHGVQPTAAQLMESTLVSFASPLYAYVRKYLEAHQVDSYSKWLQGLLGCSVLDAKALQFELKLPVQVAQ